MQPFNERGAFSYKADDGTGNRCRQIPRLIALIVPREAPPPDYRHDHRIQFARPARRIALGLPKRAIASPAPLLPEMPALPMGMLGGCGMSRIAAS